jgi:hypothetical protein
MQKFQKHAFIMGVLVLAMAGCSPGNGGSSAPDLIEPADGAVVSAAPVFVWSSIPFCDGYRIVIVGEAYTPPSIFGEIDFSDPIIEKDRTDTTYTMSGGDFDNLDDGSYYWKVASLDYPPDGTAPDVNYSEVRSFVIEKAVPLDLDTTYFPFGINYEWCYERECYEHIFTHEGGDWDTTYYDTFTIVVTDSIYKPEGWNFTWSGGGFQDIVSEEFEILNVDGQYKVPVFWDTIPIIPSAGPYSDEYGEIKVSYSTDTLLIVTTYDDNAEYTHSTWRLKGKGAIKQYYEETQGYPYTFSQTDLLLYFYDGQDTVWTEQ